MYTTWWLMTGGEGFDGGGGGFSYRTATGPTTIRARRVTMLSCMSIAVVVVLLLIQLLC
jgi:hypothetical protein